MSHSTTESRLRRAGIATLAIMLGVGVLTASHWLPVTKQWVENTVALFDTDGRSEHQATPAGADDHAHSGHGHAHDDAASLMLSAQGQRNIGLTAEFLWPVELTTFRKSITVPAVVVERPGRTHVEVTTPLTGVVTHINVVQGEAVEPGTLLFRIRLTHEDLVQAQTNFLKSLGELDVEEREIDRLDEVTRSGAVEGTLLLKHEYARDKLTAQLQAQREALRLHGLSSEQVEQIAQDRRLLRELQVFAPSAGDDAGQLKLTTRPMEPVAFIGQAAKPSDPEGELPATSPLILQELRVHRGEAVRAGDTLCTLADYDELFIEGRAFEQDVGQLREASRRRWAVEAVFDKPGRGSTVVDGLEIAYLANEVQETSRTLPFYVRLPNSVANDKRSDGHRYVEWTYFPGQRLELRVPVEELEGVFVLPVEAVAREGAESYVFQQNGDHFDRMPVHVVDRDPHSAVIANDGSLFPGDVVALRGAHQMQMALKNKSGGAVDPHAGHSH